MASSMSVSILLAVCLVSACTAFIYPGMGMGGSQVTSHNVSPWGSQFSHQSSSHNVNPYMMGGMYGMHMPYMGMYGGMGGYGMGYGMGGMGMGYMG